MKEHALKKTLAGIIVLMFLLPFLVWIFEKRLTAFLSESERIDADILIIDGWMRVSTVDSLKEEIRDNHYKHFVVAGMRSPNMDYCKMEMNGYLIFYPGFRNLPYMGKKEHLIEIVTMSKNGGIYKCHYYFHINDSIAGDFYSEGFENTALVKWTGSLNDIDSMMVQFTNDMYDDFGDRDLFVKEIRVDSTIIIPYQYNSVTDFGKIGGSGRTVNNYDSNPQLIRNRIYSYGIDTSKVTSITIDRKRLNRTLATALEVRRWFEESGRRIEGINVASMGIHTKRTWLTYKSVLDKSLKIGYISLPDYRDSEPKAKRVLRTLKETIDYFYYHLILIPFRIGMM